MPTPGSGGGDLPVGPRPQQRSSTAGYSPSFGNQLILGATPDLHVPAKAVPVTSATQDAALNELLNYLSQVLSGFEPGVGDFSAQLPGPTDLQSASLTGLERVASGESGVFEGTGSGMGLDAIRDILTRGPEYFTDQFEQGVADPAQRDLTRALDEINAQSVGSGNLFGSERDLAQRNTTADFFRNLGEERSRFAMQSMNADTEGILDALGILPQVGGMDIAAGKSLFDLGEQERGIGVEQSEFDRAEQVRQQEAIFQILELLLAGGTSPTFGVSGGFPLTSSGSTGGLLSGMLAPLS